MLVICAIRDLGVVVGHERTHRVVAAAGVGFDAEHGTGVGEAGGVDLESAVCIARDLHRQAELPAVDAGDAHAPAHAAAGGRAETLRRGDLDDPAPDRARATVSWAISTEERGTVKP